LLLLILSLIALLAGCRVEHHHTHDHHYDKLLHRPKPSPERHP
jgi:hypothetical protein